MSRPCSRPDARPWEALESRRTRPQLSDTCTHPFTLHYVCTDTAHNLVLPFGKVLQHLSPLFCLRSLHSLGRTGTEKPRCDSCSTIALVIV